MTRFLFTAERVGQLGQVRHFRVNVHNMVKPDNKYYCEFNPCSRAVTFVANRWLVTAWRKTPEYQGGFLLDGGVHMLAGLRLILGSDRITAVSAQSQQQQSYLPPVDTVDAVVQTESGATGVVSISFGSPFGDNLFEFACEKGAVSMNNDDVTVSGQTHTIEFDGKGVAPEVAEFATAIVNERQVEKRQSPEEALADLELLEQMLQSGEKQGERLQLRLQI